MELATRDPKQWGPPFWFMIETIAGAFPDGATEPLLSTTKTFFDTLKTMLPCSECRTHYANFCDATPIDLSSQKALLDWVAKLKISMSPAPKPPPTPAPIPKAIIRKPVPPPVRRSVIVQHNAIIQRPSNKVKAATAVAAMKKSCNCGGKK